MSRPPVPNAVLVNAAQVYVATGCSSKEAAKVLDIPDRTLRYHLALARERDILVGDEVHLPEQRTLEIPTLPETIDVVELVERRKKQYEQKAAYEDAVKLIPVKVNMEGPIGILIFGDPHVDDDGTDLATLEKHARLVRDTDGLFGANIGDTTNNWVGRLARLYAEQSTSAAEATALAEWFMALVRDWLFVLGGNHDLWTGQGDIIRWIAKQGGNAYYPSQTRMALKFPNGREVRINARHDFDGHSQYNPAHGVMKAFLMGFRDHIMVAGHKHISAYGVQKDADTGIVNHAIRVASYKIFDRYAQEKGLRDQHISPCAVIVINPDAPDERGLVHVFWDPEEGAEYLTYLRTRD